MCDHFATPEEIAYALSDSGTETGGPVLHCRNRILHYGGEGHTMYLGTSGSGKSRRGTNPLIRTLIPAGEAYIAVDPKGELHRATASYALKAGYDVIVIDFSNIFKSVRWNTLKQAYELYKSGDPVKKQYAMELVDAIAHALYSVRGKADPFWPESARSLFTGAVFTLFEYAKPEQINMASVYQLIAKGDIRYAGSTYLKRFVDSLPSDSVASMLLQSYVTTANDTRAGIRSVFLEGLSLFARSDGLVEMLSDDDLHINQLTGDQKIAIYIIIPDETPIYSNLCGILISQLISHYIRLAEDQYHGRLPIRHNFVIEELGNVGHAIPNLSHILSASRSRGIRVEYVLQSLSQLTHIYSSADAETIISNTDVVIAYRTNNWETLTELSRKCGEREITRNGHRCTVPLVTPTQLGAMKTGQALISVAGALRFITWLPDYEEMFDCSDWQAPVRQVRSGTSPVELFDVVKYVTDKHRESRVENDTMLLERSPFHRPRLSSLPSFEDFMARMDNQLKELDEDEEDEEEMEVQKDHKQDETITKPDAEKNPAAGYEVKVVSSRLNRFAVANAISNVCGIRVTEVLHKLSTLPVSFHCDTKKDAEALEAAISAAYGVAIIQEQG